MKHVAGKSPVTVPFAIVVATVVTLFQTACASGARPGAVPEGAIDTATGVVRPASGGVPFYPGDISLRSVPSMPRAPKRNPEQPLARWTEELIGRPGVHLYARNDGPVPLRVTKVSISRCINIEGGCVDYDPNLVLQPGEKQRLYSVVPLSKGKAYTYTWQVFGGAERTESSNTARLPQRSPAGNAIPRPQRAPQPPASLPTEAARGRAPVAFNSAATGNPLDTQGATLTLTAGAPGVRSVTSPLPATRFRSRRMRLSGEVDAREVFGAGLTLTIQVDGPGGVLTAESSPETRVTGTKKAVISVTMTIPADAKTVTLGAKLDGVGDVTVNQFKFREVLKK